MELILETKTFPEQLRKMFRTDVVQLSEANGAVTLTPISMTKEELAEHLWELSIIPELERRLDDDAPGIPWEVIMAENGITQEDIDGWEDVEIE